MTKKTELKSLKSLKKPSKSQVDRGNKVVFQHNKLIEAKYSLTLQEKRLLLWCLGDIKPGDTDTRSVMIPVREFCQVIGISPDSTYASIKKIVVDFRNKSMTITDLEERTHTYVGWLDHGKYHEKEGIIEIQFHRFLIPFLLDLKSNFTAIPLSQTLGLSSIYAIRMYELLKQYESIGERKISLVELREFLGMFNEKLKRYADFKIKVLEIAQRELLEKTDIRFEFEETKTVRRVTGLLFRIYPNRKKSLEREKLRLLKQESQKGIRNRLLELGFAKATVAKFLSSFPENEIEMALKVVLNQVKKGGILNPKALFRTSLKKGWKAES